MNINLDDVKRIAKRYGRAERICEALDISFTDYNYLMYYQYAIADNEMRSFAFKFAEAVEYGRAEHKILKLDELNDISESTAISELEKKYQMARAKRNKELQHPSLFDIRD